MADLPARLLMSGLLILVLVGGGILVAILLASGGGKPAPASAPGQQGADRTDPTEKRQALLAKNLRLAADALERVRLHAKAGDGLEYLKQPCDLALASFTFVTNTMRAPDEQRLGKKQMERLRMVVLPESPIYQEIAHLGEGGLANGRTAEVLLNASTFLREVGDALGGVELGAKSSPKTTAAASRPAVGPSESEATP
jgi:hypothetical protein